MIILETIAKELEEIGYEIEIIEELEFFEGFVRCYRNDVFIGHLRLSNQTILCTPSMDRDTMVLNTIKIDLNDPETNIIKVIDEHLKE